MRPPRRLSFAAAAIFAAVPSAALGLAGTAHAATGRSPAAVSLTAAASPACPNGLTAGPTVSPSGGAAFIVCSGRVPSFDGAPLDTDVTIPTAPAAGPRPLMIMLHGWGQDKTTWESATLEGNNGDSYHWNNAWFAAQGYVVLNYTARGFHTSCGKDQASNYVYSNDPACSGVASWTHLADTRWEQHDTQYLAGFLVDAGLANPQRIVATGGSYGGGQSWDLALSQDKVVDSTSTDPAHPVLKPWTSPKGTPMHLAAAAPMYPWTDLADALVQNGRVSDGGSGVPSSGDHHLPYGVDKQTYVAGLYADGAATAQYAAPGSDPTADLTTWNAGINAGEPYDSNPEASTALAQVGGAFRSPFAMPVPIGLAEVPTYVIQGDTDPLFDAFQALDMVNRLKAADPSWPVTVFIGDVGHSYADNPTGVWHQAHDASNAWLQAVMSHVPPSSPAVTVTTTACLPAQSHVTYSAPTYAAIAGSVVHLTSAAAQTTVAPPKNAPATPEGAATDPIANSGCRSFSAAQSDPGQAVYTFAVPSGTLVGAPTVNVDVAMTGLDAEVAARLWELNPSGTQTLVTRTVYRLQSPSQSSTVHLGFELWPQAWQFQPGDQLVLELTQNDSPVWRPDNEPSSLTFTNLDLALPLVTAPAVNVPETPIAPLMPLSALLAGAAAAAVRRGSGRLSQLRGGRFTTPQS